MKKEHKKTSYEAFYEPYNSLFVVVCVRLTGIEPALREKLDPKSSASASSATGAFAVAKVSIKNETTAMYILFFMQNVQKSGAKVAETVSESCKKEVCNRSKSHAKAVAVKFIIG